MAWYKKLRLRRIARWMANGFLRGEAVKLTALESINKFTGKRYVVSIPVTRTYAKAMMRNRTRMWRQAQKDGISKAEYERRVYNYYASNGWLKPDGTIDYWAEIRHYQRQTDYHPPKKRYPYDPTKPHKKKTAEGGIDYSHTRKQTTGYRQRDKAMGKPRQLSKADWISQLRESARTAKTLKQRRQFEQQIRNLEQR